MRKLLTLIFVVFSVVVFGQTQPSGIPSPRSDSGFAQYNWVRALKGGIIFPERDTAFTPTYIGTVVFWRNTGIDSALWVYAKTTGRRWSKVVTLSGGVSAGTVTSIATNAATGVTGGTITTSGTISLDTTLVSTRLWRQKGIDSVQYNLTSGLLLKVNISDTALMLNPYLRKTDTSAMLSNYVPTFRTIGTNAPLFGGGNLSANRTLGADTGRNAAQLVTGGSLTAVKDSLVALIASSGGGTVLSVSTTDGYGMVSSVADPTSTPNISLRVDTVSISTRDWRQKGIDSVQANLTAGLALKLNLSDTAAMLSNRLKISDTASMLLPFVQYSDTSNMLSPYRRTSTKITNSDLVNSTISGVSLGSNLNALTFGQYLQVGASSYDGSVATTITTNGTSTNVGSTLVARDANGDFTARNISATNFLGTASTASTVAITNDITTNATYYPMFSTVTTGSTSTRVSSSKLTYNPSTGSLAATTFVGALTGNATTASTLQTARTINGVAFDGSANITISASVDSSLTAGYGIIGSPFDGSLGRTWIIDTSNISTKANVTGALVAKLNIYDTAAMLSGYKTYYPRTAISAGTGISYNPATGVITNSSPSSGGTVTSVATNNGSGITGGTITSTGTIAADTTILSTKANVVARLLGYVDLSTNQTVGGTKTFSNDIVIQTITAGRGGGGDVTNTTFGFAALSTNSTGSSNTAFGNQSLRYSTISDWNTAFGASSLQSNTDGGNNTAIGGTALFANTSGSNNTAVGYLSLGGLSSGSNNVAIGSSSGNQTSAPTSLTSASQSVFIGSGAKASANGNTNEIVIGYAAEGNGSNTATFGNSSITNNYFTGNIRGGAFIKSGGTSTQFLKADGSVDGNTYLTSADIAGKLNISDTASMLSNYRRSTTLIENADLRNSAITINGSSTSLGGSISVGTVTSVAASAGTGISVTGSPITTSGTLTITNTAPDQTVTLTAGSGISVTGTYPNFTVTNSSPSSGGTVTSVSAGIGMSFTTITSTGAVNADTTTLATRAYAAGLDVAKANTSLNNVNGVLSSTYGGAGSVSGILKANGSGTVSAAVAGTDYVIPSALSSYVPYTGATGAVTLGTNTFTAGTINGRSIRNNGVGTFGFNSAGNGEMQMYATADGGLVMAGRGSVNDLTITNRAGSDVIQIPTGTLNVNLLGALNGTSAAFNGAVSGASFTTGNGTLSNNAFWGTLITAGAGTFSDWALLNSATEGIMYNPTGTRNMVFSGALNGTSAAFSGGITTDATLRIRRTSDLNQYIDIYSSAGEGFIDAVNSNSGTRQAIIFRQGNITNTLESIRISSGQNLLLKTTTDNGTDALQVAGSGLFTASSGVPLKLISTSASGIEYTRGSTLYGYIGTENDAAGGLRYNSISGNYEHKFYNNSILSLTIASTGAATFSSSVTASSLIKSGGTSAQFLKADGSVDGNTYLTSAGAVTSIAGTTNQITVSASTGAVTVSLPSAVTISGNMTAAGFFESSDRRLKNIISRDGDVAYFKWKDGKDNKTHIGYIAQEVQKDNPDQVKVEENGTLSVNYVEILVQKVRQLEKKIEMLEKKTKKIKN